MNLAIVLLRREENVSEAKSFLGEVLPRAERVLGPDHNHTLELRVMRGNAMCSAPDATREDCLEAEKVITDVIRRYRRRFGDAHPLMGPARDTYLRCMQKMRLLEIRADMASVSTEEKVALEEKYGLAPGILGRDAPAGKDTTKAPSIKEMKATIRKAGFGVADLVEKSDVVKRYQEALARLGK